MENRYNYNMEKSYNYRANLPYITIVLVAINVIVFMVLELTGSTENTMFMYISGAMYSPGVFEEGQWYRIITSMFMHFGYEHLLNNMFMLGILGYQLERQYGRIKYVITYFACGMVGNIVSGIFEMTSGEYAISAGASGAVFGIFGVLLVMIFKSRKQMGQVSVLRLVILFVLMVFGNMQEDVDWMAHLGGALTGVILAVLLYKVKNQRKWEL